MQITGTVIKAELKQRKPSNTLRTMRTPDFTIDKFLQYIAYSSDRPNRISPPRWRAMLRQAKLRGWK